MSRKYSLVMERGPSGFSAYVPELPAILVMGRSEEELLTRAEVALQLYWGEVRVERSPS